MDNNNNSTITTEEENYKKLNPSLNTIQELKDLPPAVQIILKKHVFDKWDAEDRKRKQKQLNNDKYSEEILKLQGIKLDGSEEDTDD